MKKLSQNELLESISDSQIWTIVELLQVFLQRDVMPRMNADPNTKSFSHFMKVPDGEDFIYLRIRLEYSWFDDEGYVNSVVKSRIVHAERFHNKAEYDLARHLVRCQGTNKQVQN